MGKETILNITRVRGGNCGTFSAAAGRFETCTQPEHDQWYKLYAIEIKDDL